MFSKLSVVVLAVAVSTGFAANQCRSGTVVNGKTNPQPYAFPHNWDETQPAPELAANQSCNWVVTIPTGYYARVVISGVINGKTGSIKTADCNGLVLINKEENKEPYFFPFPKFNVIVDNVEPSTFAFKIVFLPLPTELDYSVEVGRDPQIINMTKDVYVVQTGEETSLIAFPADPAHQNTLRSALIFKGENFFGPYLTNLEQIWQNRNQFISENDGLYIVNVEASNVSDQLLLQYSKYTRDINPYRQLVCSPNETPCTKILNGGSGRSGVVYVGNQKQTLTAITIDVTSTLDVYYGGLTNSSHHGTYSGATIQSNLPMTFVGNGITQYIVSNGNAQLSFQLN